MEQYTYRDSDRISMRRFHLVPEEGKVYHNISGGDYMCVMKIYTDVAWMININSGWIFVAHGLGIYEDGTIDWDFSKKGYFINEV